MNNHPMTAKEFRQGLMFAALIYLLYKLIALVSGLVLIFSVATIVTVVLEPAVSWLERHKIKRHMSASVLALIVIGLVGLGVFFIVVPGFKEINNLWPAAKQATSSAQHWLNSYLSKYPELQDAIPEKMPKINVTALTGYLAGGATKATASFAGAVTGAFLVLITTVYMLANPKPLVNGILKPLSPLVRLRAQSSGTRIATALRSWAVGILIGMFFIFLLTYIGLLIIGIKHALLFSLIAGLLEAVPLVGPVLSAVPPLIMALVQEPSKAVWVALAFLVIQQLEGNLLIPLVMSKQLSIHPVAVLFAVIIVGGLFGVLGVFLAVPATVVASILYDEFYLQPRLATDGTVDSDIGDLI